MRAGIPRKGAGIELRLWHPNPEGRSLPLFDIVVERKRSAGGVCPGGLVGNNQTTETSVECVSKRSQ